MGSCGAGLPEHHNRPLGGRETGGRTALPIFREIMLRVYRDQLVGRAPHFPRAIEDGIDQYLAAQAAPEVSPAEPDHGRLAGYLRIRMFPFGR